MEMEIRGEKLGNGPPLIGKNPRPAQASWEGVSALRTTKLDHGKTKTQTRELVNQTACKFGSTLGIRALAQHLWVRGKGWEIQI